jgi:hypothetical protein
MNKKKLNILIFLMNKKKKISKATKALNINFLAAFICIKTE